MESSSSSGSSKRAKAPSNITHVVSCLVDGCNSDLSQCREYHRRHKVCELHSKTPKVTIGGLEQRFCQQCSRFHSLVEFDEVKRSCRKRLDGHNRRRRKPQSESLSRNTGKFLSHQQGTTLLSFSNQQLLPIAMMDSAWAENGGVPYGSHQGLNYSYRHDNFPGSSAHSFGGGNQLSSVCQPPLLDPNSASGNSSHSPKVFSDGSSRVIDSDCALSLLSSARAETREIGLSHMVLPNPIPNMHYSNLGQYSQGVESKPVISVLNSQGGNNGSLHSQGMFQDGSPASGSHSHQTLSFRWE